MFPTDPGARKEPLTHEQMLEIVRRGESIHYGGRIISKETELPSATELAIASGNPGAIMQTEEEIEAKMKALEDERGVLRHARQQAEEAAKAAEAQAEEQRKAGEALEKESEKTDKARAASPEKAEEAASAAIAPPVPVVEEPKETRPPSRSDK